MRRFGVIALMASAACSVGSASVPTTPTIPNAEDASADAAVAPHPKPTPMDAGGEPVVNGCKTFDDKTAENADRTIVWARKVGTTCWRIKKGQSVTWDPVETFDAHPLAGDETTSPIAKQSKGSTPYAAVFAATGTFGFTCGFHFDMTGAIQVVE